MCGKCVRGVGTPGLADLYLAPVTAAGREPGKSGKAQSEPILPVDRAFVVQFGRPEVMGGDAVGRVEHVVSGRSSRFTDGDRLLAVLRGVLRDLDSESQED